MVDAFVSENLSSDLKPRKSKTPQDEETAPLTFVVVTTKIRRGPTAALKPIYLCRGRITCMRLTFELWLAQ